MVSSLPTDIDKSSNIIQPTPPRPHKQHHRLLYRGALSLPDSDLLLDGITFTAHVPPTSPATLLESPVALSLESMRGRPSLRFISCVKLAEVPHEYTGPISMYIHPRSTLAREFFEHALCAECTGPSGLTTAAIRIGLGDGYGPEETDLLVFGSLLPSQSTLRMVVARVTPPPASRKKPRPDDPIPRVPPPLDVIGHIASKKRRRLDHHGESQEGSEHHVKRGKADKGANLKMAMGQDAISRLPGTDASAKGKARTDADKFKVPGSSIGSFEDEDVFGMPISSNVIDANGLETSNKTTIKKFSVKSLATRGMPKEHPDFREIFGWITRGVGYALRNKMKTVTLSKEEVQRLVDSHVSMYFDGFGGPSGSS